MNSGTNIGNYATMTTDNTNRLADLVSRYMVLTKDVIPQMARDPAINWPVRNDHCFQRIVLDNVCGRPWFDHLARPAYKHLSKDQAVRAVQLCKAIIAGHADLNDLNSKSLIWRGKQPR
jgi:hypothetical protein